ncbi:MULTISPECIES: transposase family protein [unclassified Nocardiopsis]|uniref:transposase family protein n=1 Tax=unclassified Nocardiopsis TaxID=2649073 RepID=UPI001A8E7349|nr:transposase family protein [Nocardiopsis sp. TSRI0078]
MTIKVNRAVPAHPWLTGISQHHLAALIEELARPWEAVVEGRRHRVRGGERKRAAGAGARHRLVLADRRMATLIHVRHDLPHAVLGLPFGVDRSTISRAVGQIRALSAERGYAVPHRPGVRLRTVEDVFAYARAEGVGLRWTPPRSRYVGPARAGAGDGRSSRARRSRTP